MARRRGKTREGGFPDLTSFSDIAFLLIIYFLLATSLRTEMGLRTDIPAGQEAKEARPEERVVTLRQDGLFWGDRQVTIEQLQQELSGLKLPDKDANSRVVQFEAASGVLWQEYYEVLAAIQQAGGQPGIVMAAGEKR